MPFVQVIHWKPEEAAGLLEACRAAGVEAECRPPQQLRQRLPDAVVIDLTRLPSHGREVGAWLRETKKTRHIPIIYVDGEPEKVERIRSVLPGAIFTSRSRLRSALQSALRKGAQNAALPPPAIVRFGGRTAAQKIGIKAGMKVAAMDAVAGYEELLGALPDEVEFFEDPAKPQDLTLWFIHDFDGLMSSLAGMRRLASRTRLWIVWRKGANRHVTYNSILKAGGEVGLVLSKLCAVNDTWSAVWLVQRKVGK